MIVLCPPAVRKFQRRRVLDVPPILPSTTVDMDTSGS